MRTGVTAILPHGGNIFQDKVPAAVSSPTASASWPDRPRSRSWATLETPIVLTNTLSVPTAADAVIDYILGLAGNEGVAVGQPGRGRDQRRLAQRHPRPAVTQGACPGRDPRRPGGPVEEGAVGAGTGTVCYGFKGGIGTASRASPRRRAAIPSASWSRPTTAASSDRRRSGRRKARRGGRA